MVTSDNRLPRNMFYKLTLDDEQVAFVEAIKDPEKMIIFCNSCAGTGKTTLALGTANMLVQDKRTNYKGILYVVAPYGEQRQGFLPGNQEKKSVVYFRPAYKAMLKTDINPNSAVITDSMSSKKAGDAYIELTTLTYMRGDDEEDLVVIVDEAQNFTAPELKMVLTRFHDNCKVIVIGHMEQKDIRGRSGFDQYIRHFQYERYCAVCELTTNYRGELSRKADELVEEW